MAKHRSKSIKRYSLLLLFGELFITAGVVLGAYVVYELWISNITAKQTWASSSTQLQEDFDQQFKQYLAKNPSVIPQEIVLTDMTTSGKPFAMLYVPKLWGDGRVVPILNGVGERDLAKGIGFYPDTDLPDSIGNFGLAGHRATHGEPFANFQLLAKGDKVIVETIAGQYVYELIGDVKVNPEDIWVLDPKPNIPGVSEIPDGSKIITLTTCDPRWSSEHRWIWFGLQKSFIPRANLESSNS